jgi:DNA-binding transcriptional regulator YiaG
MKPDSKYYPLFEHLQQCTQKQTILTFAEVEQILQKPLPVSANQRAWWSNRDTVSALQSGAWVQAGYHVEAVDFAHETVTFQKFQAEYKIQRVDDAILWNNVAIRALRKHMGLTQEKFALELGVRRQTVSEWENGIYEPDRSTSKHLELISQQRHFEG